MSVWRETPKLSVYEQFQIGDNVTYLPESVITIVTGYVWYEAVGSPPRILSYRLDCGVSARFHELERRK